MKTEITLAALISLALGGCATANGGKIGETGQSQIVTGTEMPAPTTTDLLAASRPYTIGPFDQLNIDVLGMPELSNRIVTADAGGRIAFPIAGTIDAGGLTPQELTAVLIDRLRAGYVRDPQVTVNLREAASQTVTVDGQVQQPGVYPVLGGMTLMKAVATARGVAEFAKLDDVVILRTVGNQRYAALYNLAAIRRGNYADPAIYANDTIVVGESRQRRIFKDFLQIVPLLTTPIIVAFQNN